MNSKTSLKEEKRALLLITDAAGFMNQLQTTSLKYFACGQLVAITGKFFNIQLQNFSAFFELNFRKFL